MRHDNLGWDQRAGQQLPTSNRLRRWHDHHRRRLVGLQGQGPTLSLSSLTIERELGPDSPSESPMVPVPMHDKLRTVAECLILQKEEHDHPTTCNVKLLLLFVLVWGSPNVRSLKPSAKHSREQWL